MIVYLHGFNSSPASGKARQLGEHMARLGRQADYYCPTLANSPRAAIAQVLAELAALDIPAISQPERYLLLVQTGDEVLDYRDAIAYYAGATQIVEDGGDHGFAGFERHFQTILDF